MVGAGEWWIFKCRCCSLWNVHQDLCRLNCFRSIDVVVFVVVDKATPNRLWLSHVEKNVRFRWFMSDERWVWRSSRIKGVNSWIHHMSWGRQSAYRHTRTRITERRKCWYDTTKEHTHTHTHRTTNVHCALCSEMQEWLCRLFPHARWAMTHSIVQ